MNFGNILGALGGGLGAGLGPAGLMGARGLSPMGMMGGGQSPLLGGDFDIEQLLKLIQGGGNAPGGNYLNMFGGG